MHQLQKYYQHVPKIITTWKLRWTYCNNQFCKAAAQLLSEKGLRKYAGFLCVSSMLCRGADFARSRNASDHPPLYMYCTRVEVQIGYAVQCRNDKWNMYGNWICNMSELSSPRLNMTVWSMLNPKTLSTVSHMDL